MQLRREIDESPHLAPELRMGVFVLEERMGGVPDRDKKTEEPSGYAENPAKHFMPSPGRLVRFRMPEPSPEVRVDTGFREGDEVTFHYDPMLAKIIVRGDDRDVAIDRMREALDAVEVDGIATNAAYLAACMEHPEFRAGDVATDFIARHHKALLASG